MCFRCISLFTTDLTALPHPKWNTVTFLKVTWPVETRFSCSHRRIVCVCVCVCVSVWSWSALQFALQDLKIVTIWQILHMHPLFVLYCIVLYCIVLYCIVLYCIVLYCIVLYCIVLYCIVLYCIVLYCIVLYCMLQERERVCVCVSCWSNEMFNMQCLPVPPPSGCVGTSVRAMCVLGAEKWLGCAARSPHSRDKNRLYRNLASRSSQRL